MKKVHVISQPTKITDMSFDDIFYDSNDDWYLDLKAEKIQNQRLRALKRSSM